jgi:hypothetical protein
MKTHQITQIAQPDIRPKLPSRLAQDSWWLGEPEKPHIRKDGFERSPCGFSQHISTEEIVT